MFYINIGPSPTNEECAQVGTENYSVRSRQECRAFANQLRRLFGEPARGHLGVQAFLHDFGTYREVVAYYDADDEESRVWAYKIESEAPTCWDAEAIAELTSSNSCGR